MNTPLMELIDKLNKRKELGYKLELTDSDESMIQINLAIHNATELLEKEMEVIEEAYNEGFVNCPHSTYIGKVITASDYYTKTFTNESK
jgi:predicted DNA binding protein